jgi:hypothetical protein
MTDRRFSEQEAAAIFEQAADAQQSGRHPLAPAEGMTLAELQAIGEEVGLPAELVAQAARSIERAGPPATRTFMGLPVGVSRTVELGRRLTEEEWERLVVDLRETFDARGVVRTDGSFRQWTNGNLQALLEPTAKGHRLRLRTYKADARLLMTMGMAGAVSAGLVILSSVAGGVATHGGWGKAAALAVLGLGLYALGAARLVGWARTRGRQMEAVADRLLAATSEPGGVR